MTKKSFKVGDMVITGQCSGNYPNYGNGVWCKTKARVTQVNNTSQVIIKYTEGPHKGVTHSCPISSLTLIKETTEELEKMKEELKEQINAIEDKIQFCKENKLKEWDEDTFKVWKVMKELDTSKSRIKQAEAIAKIINS